MWFESTNPGGGLPTSYITTLISSKSFFLKVTHYTSNFWSKFANTYLQDRFLGFKIRQNRGMEVAVYAQTRDLALCIECLALPGYYLWRKIKHSNELQSATETGMCFKLKQKKKNKTTLSNIKKPLPENL